MPLGIYPTVDYVFKRLFGDPANSDLLIHLLNAVLRPALPIVGVEIENPFLEKEFEEDKLAVLDIRACDASGQWFNVEMQSTVPTGLRERLVYYTSCLLVDQMKEGMQYRDLLPSISICFLSKTLFPDIGGAHLRFALADLEQGVCLTDRLQIHTIELGKYNQNAATVLVADSLEKWTYFLNHSAELEAAELQQLLPEAAYLKAIGIIEMISHSPEQRRLHDARLRAQRDYFSEIQGARLEGRAEGELIGRIRVLEEFAGEAPLDAAVLASLDLAQLTSIVAGLRAKLDQAKGQ